MAKYDPATRQWSELKSANVPWNVEIYENASWAAFVDSKFFYGLSVYDLSAKTWNDIGSSFYLDDYGTGLGASAQNLYMFAFNSQHTDVNHRELWIYSPNSGKLERVTDVTQTPNNAFFKMAVIGKTPLIFGVDLTTSKLVGWIYQ